MDLLNRRDFLRNGGLAGLGVVAGGLAIGCGGSAGLSTHGNTAGSTSGGTGGGGGDADLLNLALNLEFLEAEYYLRGTSGAGLTDGEAGTGAGAVTGGTQVPFVSQLLRRMFLEFALEERTHVQVVRGAIGSTAVVRPAIDFVAGFNALATAANLGAFNPFADDASFLLGAFFFEDLGVTAYYGALPSLTTPANATSAAGIMATESYHGGAIRHALYEMDASVQAAASRIASLRASLGGNNDQTLGTGTTTNISPTDANATVFARTTREILDILYLAPNATQGGFFPNGLNGAIK
ncbi:ferritin-like domain-containing protein [Fimbriimonas ginsengisoli]|uniref:Dessication-associated protein n=1 Tax=Fimbriimonas ginsengisoli Gsoil 348 TaxID=661478 RepID=A0A068NPA7_FIMGI|nr:ferritin-like domain-containing protein [Fimbriimonas ginsengisoli]AIE85207.1 Dessication-associated protein [Fimbriimonas ginsengisoli Gsoil 348]